MRLCRGDDRRWHAAWQAHVWDYCRVDADRQYLKTLSAPGLRVITPPESDKVAKFPNKWKGYYAYYAAALKEADWLIKCDDDIVFLSNIDGVPQAFCRSARACSAIRCLFSPA